MADLYEFVCDRIIPGCTHTETTESLERAREKAEEHFREHHPLEDLSAYTVPINMAIVGIHR